VESTELAHDLKLKGRIWPPLRCSPLVPVWLAWPATSNATGGMTAHAGHLLMSHSLPAGRPLQGLAAVGVHSAAYLLVNALIAVLVYEKLGVAILHRAWLNLDLVWGIALLVSAVFVLAV
jgi:hypothetical protein